MFKSALRLLIITTAIACTPHYHTQPVAVNKNISDSALLDTVERRTFNYFWDGAEPNSGMAPERIHMDNNYPAHDQTTIAVGAGSGTGCMVLLAGIERGYITRKQGFNRLKKIVSFLEKADRFHGAFPHWLNDNTGHVVPFGYDDDGGDIVETAFLFQGLLCVRQYFKDGNDEEKKLAACIDSIWRGVDFNWYRRGSQNVLYWHWSPDFFWKKNFAVHGFNECMLLYIMAAASPTHSITKEVYDEGWAQSGAINKISNYRDDTLHLFMQGGPPHGGSLFWSHYSYLGLNPHNLKDKYADYWKELNTMAKINYQWCIDNPKHFKGYSDSNWGLTASYSVRGYAAHEPDEENDLGVISPTAAISSIVYTPQQSTAAIRHWYENDSLRNIIWDKYGFYDAFSEAHKWYKPWYLAIDQGPEVVMIENYRSGLLWKLFMSCNEVQTGLKKLGFEFTAIK